MSISDKKEWYSIYWKIEDFSLQAVDNNHSLHSPAFKTPATGSNTLLELELLTINGEERELIVRVLRKSGEGILSQFHCELSFLAAKGTVLRNFQVKNIRNKLNPSIYHEFSYPQSEIVGNQKHLFLPQNTLSLCLKIPLCGIRSGQCFTRTVLHSNDFIWKIPHFTCSRPILTKIFQLASHKFAISLFKDISSSENGTVDIQVSQTHGDKQSFVSYNFDIISDKKEEISKFHFKDFISSESGQCKRLPIFLNGKFLKNNTLSLQWVFIVGVSEILHQDMPPLSDVLPVEKNYYQTIINSIPNRNTTWKEDFQRMYKEQLFCDVILRTGHVSFPAHKIVLCNRSSVFRDMYMSGMLNNESNIIDIPDIEPAAVDQMLMFIYTNLLPSANDHDSDKIAKLYYAAHKYALQELKLQCISILLGGLQLSNVCNILDLAFSHQDIALLMCVRDYVRNNDKVISSKEWKDLELNKPWLAIKLFRVLCFRNKENLTSTKIPLLV